jgi:hypothetical protein
MNKIYNLDLLSDNVRDALQFTGKVGMIDGITWDDYFARGNERWRYRQFAKLLHHNIFIPHKNRHANDVYVAGQAGLKWLCDNQQVAVAPPPVGLIDHDLFVGKFLYSLKKSNMITSWAVDRELRKYNFGQKFFTQNSMDKKYPDAVMNLLVDQNENSIAIEYEKERKSYARYRSILLNYAQASNYFMILYILRDWKLKLVIEKCMKDLGLYELYDRLAFVKESDWARKLAYAKIYLKDNSFYLNDFVQKRTNQAA